VAAQPAAKAQPAAAATTQSAVAAQPAAKAQPAAAVTTQPAVAAQPAATPAGITIEKLVFTAGVKAREPQSADSSFKASIGKLYCWTKISVPAVPASIKHVWYKDDKKIAEVPIGIKGVSARVWSVKAITPGVWKVDVVDKAGTVLGSGSVTVN
jgi:hypothetical protein